MSHQVGEEGKSPEILAFGLVVLFTFAVGMSFYSWRVTTPSTYDVVCRWQGETVYAGEAINVSVSRTHTTVVRMNGTRLSWTGTPSEIQCAVEEIPH